MNGNNPCCVGIVDDDQGIVATYKKMFERRGIAICLVAYDGSDAVKMYCEAERKPAVMIMDERMFHMSGSEATRELIMRHPGVKVIIISADADAMPKAFEAGAKIFLKKPTSIGVILQAVKLIKNNCTSHHYYYDGCKGFVEAAMN